MATKARYTGCVLIALLSAAPSAVGDTSVMGLAYEMNRPT